MKYIELDDIKVDLLREGRLDMIYLPLIEHRDENGRNFKEACEHYKEHGMSQL